jgi:hypothetical protein
MKEIDGLLIILVLSVWYATWRLSAIGEQILFKLDVVRELLTGILIGVDNLLGTKPRATGLEYRQVTERRKPVSSVSTTVGFTREDTSP